MGMDIGIVGLPNVGKSTLFTALTAVKAEAANYPFCTIEPNVGVVAIPDERLAVMAKIYASDKIIPNVLRVVDIAGLVKGASKGEGLGNQFLDNIRQVDVVMHVVRCFRDDDIIHVTPNSSPLEDIETIHTELLLADIAQISKRVEKETKLAKTNADNVPVKELFESLLAHLNAGHFAHTFDWGDCADQMHTQLLTAKPFFLVLNLGENMLQGNDLSDQVEQYAKERSWSTVKISARLESELSALDPSERGTFLTEMGLQESGLDQVLRTGSQLLNHISFFTAGKKEIHAWSVAKHSKAPTAAGKIHSDMERGFIRAEVFSFADLVQEKNELALRQAGKLRVVGKDYVVQDGDILHIRFQV